MEMFHNSPNFTNFLNNLSRKMGSSLTMSLSEGISQMGIAVLKAASILILPCLFCIIKDLSAMQLGKLDICAT